MRKSMLGGRTRVSMEELMDEGRATAPVEETAIDVALRPNVELIEAEGAVIEANDEMVARETDVVELNEAAETLEAYRGQLEQSLEENGLDRTGAAVLQVGMERTLSRIGTEINTPSMESYGSASSRIQATRLTMEAIGDKLKEIWEAIKKALVKAWEAVKSFFASIFSQTQRLRDQADKVRTAAAGLTGTPTEATVTVKGAGVKLAVGNKVPDGWAQSVAAGLADAGNAVEATDLVIKMYDDAAAALKNGESGAAAVGDVVTKYLGTLSATATVYKQFGGKTVGAAQIPGIDNSKSEVTLSPLLPGNAFFYVAKAKSGGSLAEVVAASKAGFHQMGNQAQVSDEFKVLAVSEMTALADGVFAACNAIDKRKASLEKYSNAAKALIDAGDQAAAKGGDEGGLQSVLQALPRLAENAAGWPKQAVGYFTSISGASLAVATASLKVYRAADAGTAALPAPGKTSEPAAA